MIKKRYHWKYTVGQMTGIAQGNVFVGDFLLVTLLSSPSHGHSGLFRRQAGWPDRWDGVLGKRFGQERELKVDHLIV